MNPPGAAWILPSDTAAALPAVWREGLEQRKILLQCDGAHLVCCQSHNAKEQDAQSQGATLRLETPSTTSVSRSASHPASKEKQSMAKWHQSSKGPGAQRTLGCQSGRICYICAQPFGEHLWHRASRASLCSPTLISSPPVPVIRL